MNSGQMKGEDFSSLIGTETLGHTLFNVALIAIAYLDKYVMHTDSVFNHFIMHKSLTINNSKSFISTSDLVAINFSEMDKVIFISYKGCILVGVNHICFNKQLIMWVTVFEKIKILFDSWSQ